MKKLFAFLTLFCAVSVCYADTALVQVGPDGRPYVLPIPNAQTVMPTAAAVTPAANAPASILETGSLPPLDSPGYIYYTLPGGVNLVTPWSAAILAEGYDFIGHESITQGYLPLASFWKITGVFGGGINGKGEGSPMGGAIVNLVNAKLGPGADFNIAITGGYNFNEKHALAVASGSVKFLK
jgi:hypothetical protein